MKERERGGGRKRLKESERKKEREGRQEKRSRFKMPSMSWHTPLSRCLQRICLRARMRSQSFRCISPSSQQFIYAPGINVSYAVSVTAKANPRLPRHHLTTNDLQTHTTSYTDFSYTSKSVPFANHRQRDPLTTYKCSKTNEFFFYYQKRFDVKKLSYNLREP